MTERAITLRPLDELEPNPSNPKDHDLGLLFQSLGRFGVADLPVVDDRTGRLVSGHGRRDALAMLRDASMDAPDGVVVTDDGTWMVPVVTGWASSSDDEADAYLVAANRTVEMGGWKDDALVDLLARLAEAGPLDGVGYDENDLDDLRMRLMDPPDLDDLADGWEPPDPDALNEPSTPDPTDYTPATYSDTPAGHVVLRLTVTDSTGAKWVEHANQYATSDDALAALLADG